MAAGHPPMMSPAEADVDDLTLRPKSNWYIGQVKNGLHAGFGRLLCECCRSLVNQMGS